MRHGGSRLGLDCASPSLLRRIRDGRSLGKEGARGFREHSQGVDCLKKALPAKQATRERRFAALRVRQVVLCLRLSAEQLSESSHYDFGLRSAVAVLAVARQMRLQISAAGKGAEKEESSSASKKEPSSVDDSVSPETRRSEARVVCRALRVSTQPKLKPRDCQLFEEILRDLFSPEEIEAEEVDNSAAMRLCLSQAAAELGLDATSLFVEKGIQVLDTLQHRHGLMLVGEALSGKTAILRCLQRALEIRRASKEATSSEEGPSVVPACEVRVVSPKALSLEALYGSFDAVTREWKTGALAEAVREAVHSPSESLQWVVLDGPVDAVWVESLNTVLDENKKLCLSNGEVIALTPSTSLLFEVADLRSASPATVSRCGMVYTHSQVLPWKSLVAAWTRRAKLEQKRLGLSPETVEKVSWAILPSVSVLSRFLKKQVRTPLELQVNWQVQTQSRFQRIGIFKARTFTNACLEKPEPQWEAEKLGLRLWDAGRC